MATRYPRRFSSRFVAVLIPLAIVGLPSCARAHVIPNDARIQAFVKPGGQQLRLLVRVPLEAMVDLNYPTRGSAGEFLDLDRADRVLRELAALWIGNNIDVYEEGRLLPSPKVVEVRASLAFDGSFASYEQALQHITGPRLTNSVDFVWNQGLLDVLLESPIASDRSRYAIHSKLSTLALRTTTTLHLLTPDADTRAFEFLGDPGVITLDPTWYQTAWRFIKTGFLEIVGNPDYWLFLFVLAFPLRRVGALIPVAVSFAVAEAISLNPSSGFAPDSLWFQPLIGVAFAAVILYMAIENGMRVGAAHRWMLAFGAGLVLGFQFSLAVRDTMQFAGTHPVISMIAFAAGADIGQLLLLLLFLPAVQWLLRIATEPVATFVLALMAGDIAWHWLGTRLDALGQYQFLWPAITPTLMLVIVRWMTELVIVVAAFWLLFTAIRRFTSRDRRPLDGAISEAKL